MAQDSSRSPGGHLGRCRPGLILTDAVSHEKHYLPGTTLGTHTPFTTW